MAQKDDGIWSLVLLVFGLTVIVVFVYAGVFLVVFVGPFVLLYFCYRWYQNSDFVRQKRTSTDTEKLYSHALSVVKNAGVPSGEAFADDIADKLIGTGDEIAPVPVLEKLLTAAKRLFLDEGFFIDGVPAPPPVSHSIEGARYRDRLSEYIGKVGTADRFRDTIMDSARGVLNALPQSVYIKRAEVTGEPPFAVPLIDLLPNIGRVVEDLILPFYEERVISAGLFKNLREQFDRNLHLISKVPFNYENRASAKLIMPSAYDGTAEEIVRGYLKNTPFEDLFYASVPFAFQDSTRFEHHWIVAGSGHGKTQTLQYFIAKDIEKVMNDEASIIVIDSQGDLIRNISRLKIFDENTSRLVVIDPTDLEYPVALNLFDVGLDRINAYAPLDRERLLNGVIELYDFVFTSLLSAELTQKQGTMFRYIMRLMLQIPNATIHTLREIMEPDGSERFKEHIDKLQGTPRAFFATEFDSKEFKDTRRQVVRRLWGILENQTFERMFSHPKNKLDLFHEMNSAKVILINTSKDLLKQTGTEIFGRFFIAMIAQAAQERATLTHRQPCFVYIDECADYLDDNVTTILEQARKYNVGMILAHQYLGQLAPRLLESFSANTSIKFSGGVSDRDARAFANMMRCSNSFIEGQPKGSFAAFVRNVTPTAVTMKFPLGYLEKQERMTEEEWIGVRGYMRTMYAVPASELAANASAKVDVNGEAKADAAKRQPSPKVAEDPAAAAKAANKW